MAYIDPAELNTAIYQYQLLEITEHDNDIVLQNIAAAEAEARGYLAALYDVDTIFSSTGAAREPLLMEIIKNIAIYHIARLSNVDMLYKQIQDRYDRAIVWLKGVRDGKTVANLPHLIDASTGEAVSKFRIVSNTKFNHYF